MEKYKVRRSTQEDIDGIKRLYDYRKSNEELEWLLKDPYDPNSYRSFVAVNEENKICGHLGYLVYNYRINKELIKGVHPINWIVSPEVSGPIGILLLKKIIEVGEGDFTFMIGGAENTRNISALFRFPLLFYLENAMRVINWPVYFKLQKGNFIKKIIKTTIIFLKSLSFFSIIKSNSHLYLEKYTHNKCKQIRVSDVFYNNLNEVDINWLLDCPVINSYAFEIKKQKETIGFTVLYVNKRPNKIKTGRIVHITFIEQESDWIAVLNCIHKFFKMKGCSIITSLGFHPVFIKYLKKSGYILEKGKRPVFVRDTKNIFKNLSMESIHLTFCEADMGYRGV